MYNIFRVKIIYHTSNYESSNSGWRIGFSIKTFYQYHTKTPIATWREIIDGSANRAT